MSATSLAASATTVTATVPVSVPRSGQGGLTEMVLTVVEHLGELGIGVLVLLETVVPPIPSEVVLPLGGYLAEQGRLHVGRLFLAATVGSVLGAWLLYAAGAKLGPDRAAAVLARLPLVGRDDVRRAVDWFERRGEWAVLLGRLVPGVRSLVSLPAGAARMGAVRFTLFTALGSMLWNGLLVAAGYALGTRYRVVEKYSDVLDVIVVGAVVAMVGVLAARRLRRRRAGAHGAGTGARRAGHGADRGQRLDA